MGSISQAWAVGSSGFENASLSARSIGQSNAVVARPTNPDTVVFNPAGIPELEGVQITGGVAGVNTHTWFKSSTSTGGSEKNTPQLALVPNFYMTVNPGDKLPGEALDNRLGFGVGVNSPFGLKNRYDSTGVMGRYTGFRNYLEMIAVTMAGGVKLTDNVSVGGGAVNYVAYKYQQIANFPNSNILAAVVPGNTFADGQARSELSGNGWGWTFGALVKPAEKHRVGFYYRSRATVGVEGTFKIENLNPLLASPLLGNIFPTSPSFETTVKSDVNLPSSMTLGYAYVPSEKWAIEVDVAFTRWSVFADQDAEFGFSNVVTRGLGVTPRDYNDTWSFYIGGHYQLTDKIDLLAGALYYEAASPKGHVDNVLVDADRLAASIGIRYKVTENLDVDMAYLGMYHFKRDIANGQVFAKTGLNIDGKYQSYTNDFMMNITYRFDAIPFIKDNSTVKS